MKYLLCFVLGAVAWNTYVVAHMRDESPLPMLGRHFEASLLDDLASESMQLFWMRIDRDVCREDLARARGTR